MAPVQSKETTAEDLGSLLDARDGAVVTLVAGDMRLAAHRAVLVARSPVFSAMFGHDTLEAGTGEVSIPDVEGAVLRQLLAFLYTLQAPQQSNVALHLLAAADKYGVLALKVACEQQVAAQLTVETAAAAAVLAVRHSCESLSKTAIDFMKTHTHQVMTTEGWADAISMQPRDVIVVSRLVGNPSAEISTPDSGTSTPASAATQPHSGDRSGHTRAPASAVPDTAASPDDDAVSRPRPIEQNKETTATDLGSLLDSGDGTVVTLVAGDTRLVAHRAVLVKRSPVISGMFGHDTLEVNIPDVEGAVLRQLLAFLYTLQAPQQSDVALHLLAAADKYGVSALKAACEQQVASQLTVETAAAAAVLAVRLSCESLRQTAIDFIRANVIEVMSTQGWAHAIRMQPEDVIKVSRLLADPPPEIRRLDSLERGRRLIEAARQGEMGELEALLAAGADVSATDEDTKTALHWAAYFGHVEAARRLVARGAPVDARDFWQYTPVQDAARGGRAAVVQLLLAVSADHSARGETG